VKSANSWLYKQKSEYVLIALTLQQWLYECATMLRYSTLFILS